LINGISLSNDRPTTKKILLETELTPTPGGYWKYAELDFEKLFRGKGAAQHHAYSDEVTYNVKAST
jgi:hypothetical protein